MILPTYNRASKVGRSIESVLGQTFDDLELIVVDDSSTDETHNRIAAIRDSRLRYLRRDQRGGAAAARNTGLAHAQAPLIAFNDSDDEWLPAKLAAQIALLRASPSSVGLVYCVTRRSNGTRSEYIPPPGRLQRYRGKVLDPLLTYGFMATQTWLVRRECFSVVGAFDEQLDALEDWEWLLRFCQRYEVDVVNDVLVHAYESEDSLTRNMRAQIQSVRHILAKHDASLLRRHPEARANLHFMLGARLCLSGSMPEGRSQLVRALSIRPLKLRYAAGLVLSLTGPHFFGGAWRRARAADLKRWI